MGSVKTAIGHLEGCAGLAGLIKTVEAVRRGVVPPNMLFERLNPAIGPFSAHLRVPTEAQPWPELPADTPRRASVNSFGFGGTNAHAIVESFTPEPRPASELRHASEPCPVLTPLVVSGNSERSLRQLVARLGESLGAASGDEQLRRILFTLAERRSQLPLLAAFSGRSLEALRARLEQAAEAPPSEDARPPGQRGRIVGVFTGQGAQWATMGRELLRTSSFARDCLAALDAALAALERPPPWTLAEQLWAEADASRVAEAAVAQPLTTALQLVVVQLLRRAGVSFDCVVGHSSGEIAAAYAAGFLTAADAVRVAYCRGLCAALARGASGRRGAMLAAALPLDEAEAFCRARFAGRIDVAASNAPARVTLAGDDDAIAEALALLQASGTSARLLRVDTAYHSRHMQPCAGPYLRLLDVCRVRPLRGDPSCQWFSSVLGRRIDAADHAALLAAEY